MERFKLRFKRFWKNSLKYLKTKDYQWKWKLIYVLPLITFLLIIDITTKQIANNHLTLNGSAVQWLGINFKLIYNDGIAFGTDVPVGLMLTMQSIEIIFFILLIIFNNNKILLASASFLFSGAFGNMLDRMWNHGEVIDFICWNWFGPQTIFNFADTFVTIGIVLIFIYAFSEIFIIWKSKKENNEVETIPENNKLQIDTKENKKSGDNSENQLSEEMSVKKELDNKNNKSINKE
ncbi:signal peptidase II [Spiroplasma endosymbiont of Amphibalanus improvisus]|uniref:signal peptidase II n=1 Tax=Spiroplasma endosymbiont of Amphibalanus improvisus TaxID=3066327 RepID=UPI00313EB03A